MELIDVIDENKDVISTLPREEVISKNLLHGGSTILVFNSKGKILITRRSKNKDFAPNTLEIGQGGKVSSGETYDQTAQREIQEELGINDPKLEYLFEIHYKDNHTNSIDKVYSCIYDGDLILQEEEISESMYKTINEVKNMIAETPNEFSGFTLAVFEKYLSQTQGFKVLGCPAEGCKQCVKGEKLVLFITGMCGQRCNYCPVSENKFNHDDIFANEWQTNLKEDMLEEIRLTDAKGAGITGGDPLVKLDRTVEYIIFLKEKMGKEFHIHLYTPFQLVTQESMKKLYEAGLDEIRFHPKVWDDEEWNKISIPLQYGWDVGLEIPCLPDKLPEMKKMVDYFGNQVKFINLNELEFSDTEVSHYDMSQYQTDNDWTYGAQGSKTAAYDLIAYAKETKISSTIYFCSSHLKDRVQMGNRIKRRSKKVAKIYDEVTEEGMLIRGCVYLETPMKKDDLILVNKNDFLPKLEEAKKLILEIEDIEIDIDLKKLRLTTYPAFVEHFADKIKELNLVPVIVEEYPTADAVEVEVDIL